MKAGRAVASRSVRVALGDALLPVGRLDFVRDGPRQHASFDYDDEWVATGFDLSPTLARGAGRHFATGGRGERTRDALAGIFADVAPDSWGRRLLRRMHGEGLSELDYLVLADDATRLGALRFLDDDGTPLTVSETPVPQVADLADLTRIAHRFLRDPAGAEDEARRLVGIAGSAGGARPKATIRDEGTGALYIAKFTEEREDLPTERVEVATAALARRLGLRAPDVRLALAETDKPVGLFRRFDRTEGGRRLHVMSARTALDRKGVEPGFYSEIAAVLQAHSITPEEDMRELWRRMAFTILVRNTDDHLKNHNLVYARDGKWRLSPLFDVNPQPTRVPKLETGISPEHGFEPSLRAAIDAAPLFLLEETEASRLAAEMAEAIVANWREFLREHGVSGQELKLYAEAFEHAETEIALVRR